MRVLPLLPDRAWTAARAHDRLLFLHVLQTFTNHVATRTRTDSFDIHKGKTRWKSTDSRSDQLCHGAVRALQLPVRITACVPALKVRQSLAGPATAIASMIECIYPCPLLSIRMRIPASRLRVQAMALIVLGGHYPQPALAIVTIFDRTDSGRMFTKAAALSAATSTG